VTRLAPETTFPCPEPGCDGTLTRRWSRKFDRWFYGCDNYWMTKCPGSLGCHEDGSPMGIPADAATRKERHRTHEMFDPIWKRKHMRRGACYAHFAKRMGLDVLHIGELDMEGCQRLQALVVEFYESFNLEPPELT